MRYNKTWLNGRVVVNEMRYIRVRAWLATAGMLRNVSRRGVSLDEGDVQVASEGIRSGHRRVIALELPPALFGDVDGDRSLQPKAASPACYRIRKRLDSIFYAVCSLDCVLRAVLDAVCSLPK